MVELQAVHQEPHLAAMPRVANGLVIHRHDVAAVGLGQRAEPAGRVEGFVGLAVDLDFFESLERQHVDFPAVDDGVAEVAVLVDHAVRRPGQRVLEHVVRVLGQGADAEFHGLELVEVRDQLIGGDADEARREAALRGIHFVAALGDPAHGFGYLDVLGQVEVVQAAFAGDFGDHDVAEVGQPRDDGHRLVRLDVLGERGLVARIEDERHDRVESVAGRHLGGRAFARIRELHTVIAAVAEQSGNQDADLAGAENEDVAHECPACNPAGTKRRPTGAGFGRRALCQKTARKKALMGLISVPPSFVRKPL